MTRAQVIQYVAALAGIVGTVLTDPEAVQWLLDHPGTTGSLLSAPSMMTLVGYVARAIAKRKATPELPPSMVETQEAP